jgi:hypothetical protein
VFLFNSRLARLFFIVHFWCGVFNVWNLQNHESA